jgi:glycosyl transferase, family 25
MLQRCNPLLLTMPLPILNTVFEKVYVLTLPRLHERHTAVQNELRGLQFEWWYGIDKNDTTLQQLTDNGVYSPEKCKHQHRYGRTMALGMVCCAVGHRMMYEHVLANGYERVLILEDDAIWTGAAEELTAALANLPPDWDLLYLGYEKNECAGWRGRVKQVWYHILHALGFLKWNHQTISHLYPSPYNQHWRRAGFHDCTHAYAVSRRGAEKLLAMQTPVGFIADNLLAHACASRVVNGYVSRQKIFNQHTAFTNSGRSLTQT